MTFFRTSRGQLLRLLLVAIYLTASVPMYIILIQNLSKDSALEEHKNVKYRAPNRDEVNMKTTVNNTMSRLDHTTRGEEQHDSDFLDPEPQIRKVQRKRRSNRRSRTKPPLDSPAHERLKGQGKDGVLPSAGSNDVNDLGWLIALRARTQNQGILRKRNLHWTIGKAGSYNRDLYSPPPNEVPEQRLPQAIIIGVGHCGTRALIEFLKMHPYIVPSSMEIHFFDRDENFAKGLDWYKAQMPLSYSNQITIEKTPSYIWSERALHEIYKMNKNIRMIVILRDPISRLVSLKLGHHELLKTLHLVVVDGVLQVSYDSKALADGVYVTHLRKWFSRYSPSQIHVIESSEFVKHPAQEIEKVESFLGVPHFITEQNFYFNASKRFYCMRPLHVNVIQCLSERKGRQHPKLTPLVDKIMYDYYRKYNEELFQLIGRRFPWDHSDNFTSVPS